MKRRISAMDCDIFNELRLDGKLCDVIIIVDGQEFKAHKNILCSCSAYFRALFTSGWSNTEKKVYDIPGVSPDMMNVIIEYAYSRTVHVTADNVKQLLATADHFGVLGLLMACCEFLECQLCLENCIEIFRFADHYCCLELKCKAQLFILRNFEEMVKVSKEFLQLAAFEIAEIIEKDELNVKQENVVFKAIVEWIASDPHNRKKFMPFLLSKVRLALLNAEYFMCNVKNNDYVNDNDECKPIIINVLRVMDSLSMIGLSHQDYRNLLTRPRLPDVIFFAVGGWSGDSPTNAIEAYDARANKWVDVTFEGEAARTYHGVAFLEGYMYIIGGYSGEDYLSSVRRFDPVRRTWQQVAPMHSSRCFVSVTVLNGFIYALGGFDGYIRLNSAERYDPKTNQWTLISSMHEQRSDSSATTLHGKIYICGGFTGNDILFTVETYNPATNQWTFTAPMTSRRSGIGVITHRGHVYAVGGFDGTNRLHSAEAYNPLTNTWHTISNMVSPRSNFGIGVVDGLLLVTGGFNGSTTIYSAECYDEKADRWHEVDSMSLDRSGLSCCVIPGLPNVREYTVPRGTCDEFLF
ncbi:kelch-like protein 10 [Protopterus annectens]|uniref:kelch-like protein 10 n=1 Tax=Protopterus annectens TaxID=7888 RepID=UPI001CFB3F33|nr:kelch-like protein 10 [Protopterus annectens]